MNEMDGDVRSAVRESLQNLRLTSDRMLEIYAIVNAKDVPARLRACFSDLLGHIASMQASYKVHAEMKESLLDALTKQVEALQKREDG